MSWLKVTVTFIITLNTLLAPVSGWAEDPKDDPKNNSKQGQPQNTQSPAGEPPAPPENQEAVYFHAESPEVVIHGPAGHDFKLSTSADTIFPTSPDAAEEIAVEQIAKLHNEAGGPEHLFITEDDGTVREVLASEFLDFVRKKGKIVKEATATLGGVIKRDVKEDRYLPYYTVGRSSLNYIMTVKGLIAGTVAASAVHAITGDQVVAAHVGALTCATMSAILMLFSSPIVRWQNSPKRLDLMLIKQMSTQFPYILIFKGVMWKMHQALDPTLWSTLTSTFATSVGTTLTQGGIGTAMALKAEERVKNLEMATVMKKGRFGPYPVNADVSKTSKIVTQRNFGFLLNSGFIALISALDAQHVPGIKLIYLVTSLPAWLYVGYKSRWETAIRWQIAKIELMENLLTLQAFEGIKSAIKNAWNRDRSEVPQWVKDSVDDNDKVEERDSCRQAAKML